MDIIFTEQDLPQLGELLAHQLSGGEVVTLTGVLAAGKTSLIRAIVAALGYQKRVASPTFVLERQYAIETKNQKTGIKNIIHLDLYRLAKEDLASFAWNEDFGRRDTLTLIEWPEIASSQLPAKIKQIKLEVVDSQHRRLITDDFTS